MKSVLKSVGLVLLTVGSVMILALGLTKVINKQGSLALAQNTPQANPMRAMMRQMMRGVVPPPGMTPDTLPAPKSEGARLTGLYCAQCHDLPSPRYKTATEWPAVFGRMLGRMNMMSDGGMMGGGMMGMGRLKAPSPAEAQTLLVYLQSYAMVPATQDELRAGDPADLAVFQADCSRCHALPSPSLHTPQEWPGMVDRMEDNMGLMNQPQLTSRQRLAIIRFLKESSTGKK